MQSFEGSEPSLLSSQYSVKKIFSLVLEHKVSILNTKQLIIIRYLNYASCWAHIITDIERESLHFLLHKQFNVDHDVECRFTVNKY